MFSAASPEYIIHHLLAPSYPPSVELDTGLRGPKTPVSGALLKAAPKPNKAETKQAEAGSAWKGNYGNTRFDE